jgi:hypothetical protein
MNADQINQSILSIAQAQNATAQAIRNSFGQFVAVPGGSSASGVAGNMAYDGTHLYLCVSSNSWIKFTGSTF